MIIGKFVLKDGIFTGEIVAGFAALPAVAITPAARTGRGQPDYRVTAAYGELGAAWKKTSGKGSEYLSVKLDSPLLPAPVYCALIKETRAAHVLVWNRGSRTESDDTTDHTGD